MRNVLAVACGVLWLVPAASAVEPGPTPVLAGAAVSTFALPAGVPLAGYSRRKGQPSQGIHDPVCARAVVLEHGATQVVLVSADVLIIDEMLYAAVRRRLLAAGLEPDFTLWLAATHTHSGPGAYGRRFAEKISMGHFDPAVFDALVRGIVEAVQAAGTHLVPVAVGYQTVATEGLVKNRAAEAGLTDNRLVVIGLFPLEAPSTPLAVLGSFAAHPTALGAWNRQLSADYPGVWATAIEQAHPGTVALFFAGAVGDQAPVKSGEKFERAAWIGEALARHTLAALTGMSSTAPPILAGRQRVVLLPRAQVRFSKRWALPGWLSRRLADDDATLTAWRLGDIVALGAPCDLETALGAQLHAAARAQGRHPLVVSFVDDYIGYCVSPARYADGEYEALMAFNGPTTGPRLVEELQTLMEQLP